jgi:uncharacterized protein
MRILRSGLLGLLALLLAQTFALALDFPALTGRVVDQAGILIAADRDDIAAKSRGLEEKTGIQLVVATVDSLHGSDIETYANQMFRTWKLGQADKNNGILLLVAPYEHKVRIEVGYGLEGTLTDASASTIISRAIIPRFKDSDFSTGVEDGVNGILDVLGGDAADWQAQAQSAPEPVATVDATPGRGAMFLLVLFMAFFLWVAFNAIRNAIYPNGRYVKRHGRMVFVPANTGWTTGGSSSSSSNDSSSGSSDSFSGGGGSSGGGGASGSW